MLSSESSENLATFVPAGTTTVVLVRRRVVNWCRGVERARDDAVRHRRHADQAGDRVGERPGEAGCHLEGLRPGRAGVRVHLGRCRQGHRPYGDGRTHLCGRRPTTSACRWPTRPAAPCVRDSRTVNDPVAPLARFSVLGVTVTSNPGSVVAAVKVAAPPLTLRTVRVRVCTPASLPTAIDAWLSSDPEIGGERVVRRRELHAQTDHVAPVVRGGRRVDETRVDGGVRVRPSRRPARTACSRWTRCRRRWSSAPT